MSPEQRERFELGFPVELAAVSLGNPTMRRQADGLWWAVETPQGPGTLHLEPPEGHTLVAEAWGPGAGWLMVRVPDLVGVADRPETLDPGPLARLARGLDLRMGRTGRVIEALVPAVLGQKVQVSAARASLWALIRAVGRPAPGPLELPMVPSAERLAAMGSYEWHPFNVERKRAETVIRAARLADRLEALIDRPDADVRLQSVRGIGPWTAAWVRWQAGGDADAVPVGDFHLPDLVAWNLAGEPRGTDERMLELLAPFAGHRGRVVRLLKRAGRRPPRYGPRLDIVDFRRR